MVRLVASELSFVTFATGKMRGNWGETQEIFFANQVGGSCEIRTHGGLTSSPVFKTGALNRSAKLPSAKILTAGFVFESSRVSCCCLATGQRVAHYRHNTQ